MFAKATLASIVCINLLGFGYQAPAMAQAAEPTATSAVEKRELTGYFLTFNGRALPVKQASINGAGILTAPIISLTLPVNISGFVRPGLNELAVEYISDAKTPMNLLVEKRTAGPKKEELAKLVLPADQSSRAMTTKKISFSLPSDQVTSKIEKLSDDDKKSIEQELQNYWNALSEHKGERLKAIYKDSLDDERKLCPESASFFDKILVREASVLRNPAIKLEPLDTTGLNFKVEGDRVKLYREDKKPLLVSNEVDVQTEPVMVEVQGKGKTQSQSAKAKTKEKIVRYFLYFKQNSQDGNNEWSLSLPPNA